MSIGFIGQGFIGKNYADDFEERGLAIVRYGLEKEYVGNREAVGACDVVFIAVPTPTTPKGFDDSILRSALSLLKSGAIAVIKSTITMGTTETLQKDFPHLMVLHAPEFLREKHAAYDARHPERNIIGIPEQSRRFKQAAERVLALLPRAPFQKIMDARAAEMTKYAGNCFLMTKVVFMNALYDLAQKEGVVWRELAAAMSADPRIGASHLEPVHESGHGGGAKRGAGGHCFIKDFAALVDRYARIGDNEGLRFLEAIEQQNTHLFVASGKDLDLVQGVYGKSMKPKKRRAAQTMFKKKTGKAA